MLHTKMLGVICIFVYSVLFLVVNGDDPATCSMSWGPSCPSVTPLVSGPNCPEGFDQVEQYCFKVGEDLAYWNESKHKCEEINAKLAEPRELLINSTVFANYLWEHTDNNYTDYYEYYYDYGFYDRTFSLGGQFTNNSWEWLTGGNVSSSYSYLYGAGCLAINVYNFGEIATVRSGEFRNIGFYLLSIPCNSSSVKQPQREYVEGPYRYVCQAALENNSYSPCELGDGAEYPSGELVSMDTQQCQQHWCQDGDIQQYTCGNITTGCCAYKGQMYGDGDIIGPEVPTDDCSGCQQRVCKAGAIQWQDCTNCSVQCCYFNGASYQPGSHIQTACARLVCEGTTGQFDYQGIDYNCPKCKAYLDPHIVTYDQKWSSYSYQGCGNYSLSQIGNSYDPTLAIYATFVPCGGSWDVTCVDTVTLKNDQHTVITIGYREDEYEIQVNGNDYIVPGSSSPIIVQIMNTVYPVLTWKYGNCVSLQGSSGILVRFCGSSWSNQAYVWVDLDIAEELKGLCGTVNDDVDDDFSTRNGTVTSPWQRNPLVEFPLSWLTSNTSNGSCDSGTVRVKRQAQNNCETNSATLDNFNNQCKTAVMNGFPDSEPEEVQTIIDDCVFDLCNVSDPGEWISAVRETAEVQAEIQQNTLNFTTTTTTPPTTTTPTTTTTTTTTPTTTTPTTTTTTTPEPTTVEPSTTTPNATIDCDCKRKCWKKSGYCTNEPETCDGRIRNRGCDGPGCVCCIPQECRPKKKCYRKGGYCTSSDETCDGITTKGCWGEDCVCCLKKGRCQPKKKCWNKGGFCVTDRSTCKGKIINNGCQTDNCFCCVNQPKC